MDVFHIRLKGICRHGGKCGGAALPDINHTNANGIAALLCFFDPYLGRIADVLAQAAAQMASCNAISHIGVCVGLPALPQIRLPDQLKGSFKVHTVLHLLSKGADGTVLQGILHADIYGIQSQLVRCPADQRLCGKGPLGSPKASHGMGRRLVGVKETAFEPHVWYLIGPCEMLCKQA